RCLLFEACRESLNFLLLLRDRRFQRLDLAVLFEKLVQQHRVHRLIATGDNLTLVITRHEIGVDLFHLLGHQAKLRDALGIERVLVAEGHRFEPEDHFARTAHRLDRFLETLRGGKRTELAVGTDNYPYATWHGGPTNAGDKRRILHSHRADADFAGLAGNT